MTAAERVDAADVLRGLAIFGILLVNMRYFNTPFQLDLVGETRWNRPQDAFFSGLVHFFAEGKFYVLFSFLFGWGFSVFMERAEARGAEGGALYRRRTAVLAAIGALHVLLLWFGDILFVYALLGFTLPGFRKRTDRSLRRWIGTLLVIPMVIQGLLVALGAAGRTTPEGAAQMEAQDDWFREMGERAMHAYTEGTFGAIFAQRLADWGLAFFGGFLLSGMGFYVLAMFLLGLYAGRRRWLHEAPARPHLWRRVLVWGLPIGIAANVLYLAGLDGMHGSDPGLRGYAGHLGFMIGGPTLSAAYVAAVLLWMRRERARARLVALLAPVGRMALTNYLLQSVVCTTIFYSYGLALFGRTSPGAGIALAVGIFAAQVAFSRAWLARYRFGPAEWAWRALTYGARPPLRR